MCFVTELPPWLDSDDITDAAVVHVSYQTDTAHVRRFRHWFKLPTQIR